MENNAITTQLVVTTGTNLFQHQMPRNLKLSHVPKSHTLSRKTMLTMLKSILAQIKGEDIDITSDSDNDKDQLEIL